MKQTAGGTSRADNNLELGAMTSDASPLQEGDATKIHQSPGAVGPT